MAHEQSKHPGAGSLELDGRVCVITGGAGHIGAEIARALAAAGASVALLDRKEESVRTVASEIEEGGTRSIGVFCDVTDPNSVRIAAETVAQRLGRTDVLINNAAAISAESLMDVALDKWNQQMAVNLTGYFLCAQTFGRQMMEGSGGSMVHISSLSGRIPQPYSGAYSVSKAGVRMLSQLLAVELAEHSIRSNVVSPAMVRTPMSEVIYQDPKVLRHRERLVPVGRIGAPRDIAQAVLFLASDRASYINGQDLLIDGGLTQTWLSLIPRPGFEKTDSQ